MDDDKTREPAKIEKLAYDDDRCSLHVICSGRTGGWGQGFGGYMFGEEEHRKAFVAAICETFGVADPELLIGQPCYVLRCWGGWGETIEGLESEATGRQFIAHDWLRERFPESDIKSPLDRKAESLRSTIQWAERRWLEARRDLDRVEDGYVRWGSR